MHMLLSLLQLVEIQVFWFSVPVLGLGTLLALRRQFGKSGLWKLLQSYVGLGLLACLAAGFLVMTVVAVPMYLLHLPAIVFTASYCVLLVLAVWFVVRWCWRAIRTHDLIINLKSRALLIALLCFVPLTAVLLMDYAFSLYVGAQLAEGSDSYVHVAKIVTLLHHGFSIDDGFLAGVAESRYHINIVHALYVVPAQLFGIEPVQVWRWSLAFFRLAQWVALFALFEFVLQELLHRTRRVALRAAAIMTIVTIAFLSARTFLFVANYPDKVVSLWITLFVLLLFVRERLTISRGVAYALYGAALLITATHPTYALMTALFMMLFTAVRTLVMRQLQKAYLLSAAIVVVILMAGPFVTVLFPSRMTDFAFNFGDFSTLHVLHTTILKPYIPGFDFGLLLDSLAFAGYGALLYAVRKNKGLAALVASLLIFLTVTAFDPLFMLAVGKELPLWLVARFGAMNVLAPLGPLLGAFVLGGYLAKRVRVPRAVASIAWTGVAVVVCAVVLQTGKTSYHNFYKATKSIDHGYTDFMLRTAKDLGPVIPNGSMVVANLGDSYFLPATIPVHVVAIYEAHATPVAASTERLQCLGRLQTDLSPGDLAAVKADYVVLAPWDARFDRLHMIVQEHDYFHYVHRGPDYLVYKVDRKRLPAEKQSGPCVEYQRIERGGRA